MPVQQTEWGEPAWQVAGYRSEAEWNAASQEERNARLQRGRNAHRTRERNFRGGYGPPPSSYAFQDLGARLPTPDDLSVEYEEDPGFAADWTPERGYADPESTRAQSLALQRLMDLSQSGYSDSDRARMEVGRQEVAQAMRGQREADMASLQARGMGGSGTQVASLLGAQQSGASALSQRDAAIQAQAAQRALAALQAGGSLASQRRGQSYGESQDAAQAWNDYNRWNTEYGRGQSRYNTEQRNRSRESARDAAQRDLENQMAIAAGQEGHATAQITTEGRRQEREDRWTGAGLNAVGGLVSRLG